MSAMCADSFCAGGASGRGRFAAQVHALVGRLGREDDGDQQLFPGFEIVPHEGRIDTGFAGDQNRRHLVGG